MPPVDSSPRSAQMLLRDLAGRVHVARVQPRGLVDQARLQRPTARRARRLEAPRVQVSNAAGTGRHRSVRRAHVGAFAVDDHRAGQHQPANTRPRHLREQDSRSQVVTAHVVRCVGQVDPEADLRCLMAHDLDPVQGVPHGRGVAQVGHPQRRLHVRADPMDIRQKRVEHADLVPAGAQRGDYGTADEAGPTRDEHTHGCDGSCRAEGTRSPLAAFPKRRPSRRLRQPGAPAGHVPRRDVRDNKG